MLESIRDAGSDISIGCFFGLEGSKALAHLLSCINTMGSVPQSQRVLSLPALRQRYQLEGEYPIPSVQHEYEILVRSEVIGLNPIDWKAP